MFLLTLLCLGAAADEATVPSDGDNKEIKEGIVSRPRSEPYIDDATGIEFPPELSGFIKTQVVKNVNPFYGTVVRYASHEGACADVYIYTLGQPLNDDLLKTHFQGVLKVISNLPSTAKNTIKGISMKSQTEASLGARGSIKAQKALFSFDTSKVGSFDSELLVFAFRDRVIKLRISSPIGLKEAEVPFDENLARLCEKAADQLPPPEIAPSPTDDAKPAAP